MARFDLTDAEWALIEPHVPVAASGPLPRRVREQFNGILWRFRTGYGPPQPSDGPGTYASQPEQGVISASSAVVSALIPTTAIYPGGNDGDHWVSSTILVPTAKPIGLADLFISPTQALNVISALRDISNRADHRL